MTGDLTTIRNIGPATAASLAAAGIPDAATLRRLGADAAYARLIAYGERPHFIGYYILHMALQGRAWNDCKGAEKEALRVRFDALVGASEISPGIEAELDRIGLRLSRPTTGTPR